MLGPGDEGRGARAGAGGPAISNSDGGTSNRAEINIGVPQGSCLGLVLLLLYIYIYIYTISLSLSERHTLLCTLMIQQSPTL